MSPVACVNIESLRVRGDQLSIVAHCEIPQSDVDALASNGAQRQRTWLLVWTLTTRRSVHSQEPV